MHMKDLRRTPGFKGKAIMASLTDEQKLQIRKDVASGVTYSQIGISYGVTGGAVRWWFRKFGWPETRPSRPETTYEHLGYLWTYERGNGSRGRVIGVHRRVMEQMIGRRLQRTEIVHHSDGNRMNNNPSNLELFESISAHMKHHRPGVADIVCISCGSPAYCTATLQGNVPRCQRCYNHARRYHRNGKCSMTKGSCPLALTGHSAAR